VRVRVPYALSAGPPRAIARLQHVSDATYGYLVGELARPSHCSVLADRRGRPRWQTCDHRLLDTSPDGRHLLGMVGPSRYGRVRAVSLFTRAGDLVAEWARPPGTRIEEVRWEDAGHVLAVVHSGAEWSLVRVGTDGSVEYALAPRDLHAQDSTPLRLPMG
jgi:hypothetical protein